ncbi:outer membrane receptor protein involved in Fe transport [Rhodovulum sulfidophilum]|uniref:TonB-dependent receptor n=1 Tax=Rhodovulum sulfidophilum TaxID=35806 RepID=UPI0005A8A3AF|nr:TonB-dependent receptor [Rhodovulum sulfidophilum]ANB36297.1 iron ABC transporter substrate-binding protein [Rhodovulum sulfidophilum DSM 1374]ANB40099.1 iron ABC transporter substrate-binding protein [Rhodovulum sulfidophilum]MCW2304690.1 outer membrane receptor protein involved in Fe transport [Rhodovulum sulfidophilum]
MVQRRVARLFGGASIVALCAVSPTATKAQDLSDDAYSLGTLFIIGDTLIRSFQKTAASVTAVEEADIEAAQGKDSVKDIVADMANVTYAASGGQGGAPTIRGQDGEGPNSGAPAFFGGSVPRIAVNLDGHYLSYNELVYSSTSIWDVDHIELFRGPQTISQGANSIAGALVVKTKDPTFEREGAVRLEYGSRGKRRASLMASGAVAPDLAARIALDYSARDNYIDYVNPAFSLGGTDQDHLSQTARFKLLWTPAAMPGFEAMLTFSHTDSNRPTWEAATVPFSDYDSTVTQNPSWKQFTNTTILDLKQEFDNGATLTNQSQFSSLYTRRTTSPVTAGSAVIDQDSYSNETRLTFGNEATALSGVAGLYLSHTDSDETLNLRGATAFDDTKDSLGIFAGLDYDFADRWTISGSVRYQRDRVQREGSSSFATNDLDYDETFDDWLPKLSLSYDVNDTTTIGAMVSKGYNPGGVTLGLTSGEWVTFDPETSTDYELFARTRVLDDRLGLSANLFYTDFKNMQRYVTSEAVAGYFEAVTVNAEEANAYGLELGFDYEASQTLRLYGSLGLLSTEIEKFSSAGADYSGNEFGRAPGQTISLGADWKIRPDLTLSGNVRYSGSYFSDDDNLSASFVDSYTVANTRIAYDLQDNLQLYGYVNNLFDEDAVTYLRASRAVVGGYEATLVEPREIGIGVKMTF